MAWINATPARLRDEQSDVMDTRITIKCNSVVPSIHMVGDGIREPHCPWFSNTFHLNDSPGSRAMLPLPIPILFVWVSCKTKQVLEPFFP